MRNIIALICLSICFSCGQRNAKGRRDNQPMIGASTTSDNNCGKLDGNIFRYKYDRDTPDSESFTIIFQCKTDTLHGIMFGPYPAGDEGLYFFREKLDSMRLENGLLSFSLAEKIYYKKPFTLTNYNKHFANEQLGRGNGRQFFNGKLDGDSVVFVCNADYGECYADTMVFRKM